MLLRASQCLPALYSNEDPDAEAGSDDDQSAGQKKKQAPKSKTNSKKKPKPDEQDEGNQAVQAADGTELPPKSVAIHRVRWNLNSGSEKWLCYGGAAGIVRCQWMDTPPFD